jgi:hypothetical protein
MEEEMRLRELKAIIDGLVETHGGDMDTRFKYRFGSGRTSQGPVTGYEVHPPKSPLPGSVRFTIDHARGDPEK